MCGSSIIIQLVSTHSRPKAAGALYSGSLCARYVSTHSRPKAAGAKTKPRASGSTVSTHSRPKAAGSSDVMALSDCSGFNTQPPEGGWICLCERTRITLRFQHTAARRRLGFPRVLRVRKKRFQHTAARRRLAPSISLPCCLRACFNTQPPEGGWSPAISLAYNTCGFQHTAARRRLGRAFTNCRLSGLFQHTAARRRLAIFTVMMICSTGVSTHSRPKAAGLPYCV